MKCVENMKKKVNPHKEIFGSNKLSIYLLQLYLLKKMKTTYSSFNCLFVCLFVCFVLFFSPFIKVFAGNYDQKAIVYHDLSPPIVGRYIRFRPVNWQEGIAMRVELFGCSGNLK